MSDERPDALLKSALEKIVYFEARSKQLETDVATATAEVDRLKRELGEAAQREMEARRMVASLEVEVARAHREREELARVVDSLKAERVSLLDQLMEASRIAASGRPETEAEVVDLAAFIAQLRSEVLSASARPIPAPAEAPAPRVQEAVAPAPAPVPAAAPAPVEVAAPVPAPAVVVATTTSGITAHAERLKAQGRLQVSVDEMERLSGSAAFKGRTEETLFGFSIRELSAPDPAARARAADRLRALKQPAAAPALATALNGEQVPEVQVALLNAFAEVASKEGAAIVLPLLDAPSSEVRITALKTLLALDASQAGPHLSAAMRDPDRAVRRRASLLALGLSGEEALGLGEQAIRDADPEVRSLGALVLGAGGGDRARELLLGALRDPEKKVRKAAAQSLSRLLGQDLSAVVDLDEPQRRREVRKLATLPLRPVSAAPATVRTAPEREVRVEVPPPRPVRTQPALPPAARLATPAPPASPPAPAARSEPRRSPEEALCAALAGELRVSIRGRTLAELVSISGAPQDAVQAACELLVARGQARRRGTKYFTA